MRINDKILEIEKYLEEFEFIIPSSFEEYKFNIVKKAACERYVEKIVEAVVDFAFLIIKKEGLTFPEDDKSSFDILLKNGLIDSELCENLKNAKGMRNIIAHEYGKVDDEIIFETISEKLIKDVKNLIKNIRRGMK